MWWGNPRLGPHSLEWGLFSGCPPPACSFTSKGSLTALLCEEVFAWRGWNTTLEATLNLDVMVGLTGWGLGKTVLSSYLLSPAHQPKATARSSQWSRCPPVQGQR